MLLRWYTEVQSCNGAERRIQQDYPLKGHLLDGSICVFQNLWVPFSVTQAFTELSKAGVLSHFNFVAVTLLDGFSLSWGIIYQLFDMWILQTKGGVLTLHHFWYRLREVYLFVGAVDKWLVLHMVKSELEFVVDLIMVSGFLEPM